MKYSGNRKKKICIFTAIILLICIFSTACKESPVLREVRYTDDASLVDTDVSELDPEDWGQLEEQFQNEQNEQSDTDRDEDDQRGLEDEENQTDHATDIEYRADATGDMQNSDSPSYNSQENGSGTGNATNSGDSSADGTSPEYIAGDASSSKQIVDASGRIVDVPLDVGSMTAVGAAAQMVEMLSGSGKLLGADSEFLSSSLAKAVFSDLGGVNSWWSGAGSDGISDSDFAALLAAKPDVCIELSGADTFSAAQTAELSQAGIAYVVLPALSSQENLEHAVTLMGQILGDSAISKAEEYNRWVESTVSTVSGKTSGDVTSLYIKEWDASATYNLNANLSVIGGTSGNGLAVAYSPKANQLVSTFMEAAHVSNESTRLQSVHRKSSSVYVTPMFHQFNAVVSGSAGTYYSGNGEYGSAYDLFVSRMVSDSVYNQLGSSAYPAVIAADSETKQQLENNWFWQYHSTDSNGYVSIDGSKYYCGIAGEYQIYVNPQGMLSWAEGSLESPLEAYWTAAKFSDAYSVSDVKKQMSEFYQKFFGYTLSDSQLNTVFNE